MTPIATAWREIRLGDCHLFFELIVPPQTVTMMIGERREDQWHKGMLAMINVRARAVEHSKITRQSRKTSVHFCDTQ
jgi:hypothetical protein